MNASHVVIGIAFFLLAAVFPAAYLFLACFFGGWPPDREAKQEAGLIFLGTETVMAVFGIAWLFSR